MKEYPDARRSLGSGQALPSDGLVTQGDLFLAAGDLKEAATCYQKALGADSATRRDLSRRVTEVGAAGVAILRRWAECLERDGRYAEALEVTEPALPYIEEADPLEASRLRLVRGKILLESGRYDEAGDEARAGLDHLGPESGRHVEEGFLSNLLGGHAYRRGLVPEASVWFHRALDVFKGLGRVREMALAYSNLGHVAKRRGEWGQALEFYQVARNLASTEGASRDRIGALLNIAYVKLHKGRLADAAADFEEASVEARQVGDGVRWIRAMLGRIQASRIGGRLREAARLLTELKAEGPAPGLRERILTALEDGWLAQEDGRHDRVHELICTLHELLAEGSGLGGDLRGEVRRLQAWSELSAGQPSAAVGMFEEAAELAAEASDLVGTDAARLGRAVGLRHLKQWGASESELSRLISRLQSRGEKVGLGLAILEQGHTRATEPKSGRPALQVYEEATRIFQEVGIPTLEARAWLAQGRWCLDEGDLEGARVRVSLARQALRSHSEKTILPEEDELLDRLSKAFEQRANSGLNGFDAFRQVEAAFRRGEEIDPLESLRDVLGVVRTALDADGILYGWLRGDKVEVLGSRGMARLDGRRSLALKFLAPDRDVSTERACILVGPDLGEGAASPGAASQSSALVVPLDPGDGMHVLYVERLAESGRPTFQPGEAHYASALGMELARGLRRSGWRKEPEVPGHLKDLSRNIYLADIVTQNPRMFRILELILRVAPTDMTVLLQGETGTGKRLLAEAIHRVSRRGDCPFVTVDCAALPETLLESELFGYRKGAFTGAAQDRMGLLEEAEGGTIFLDEIDKAGVQVQRRFLHLLDVGEVRPVGATSYRRLNVRIVGATSCPDLGKEVEEGRFLKDLYYRMNDIMISVPTLRERKDDVALLAETFMDVETARQKRVVESMSPGFLQALLAHDWPGNVRELEKAIRRAVTLAGDEKLLTPDLLPEEITGPVARPRSRNPLKERVEDVERDFILATLDQAGWNKSLSARRLGLSRKGLRNKIERYGLERRRR